MLAKKWSLVGWFIFQLASLVLNVSCYFVAGHTQNLCVHVQYLASIRIQLCPICRRRTHTHARTCDRCHFYELFISLWMKNVFKNTIWCVQHATETKKNSQTSQKPAQSKWRIDYEFEFGVNACSIHVWKIVSEWCNPCLMETRMRINFQSGSIDCMSQSQVSKYTQRLAFVRNSYVQFSKYIHFDRTALCNGHCFAFFERREIKMAWERVANFLWTHDDRMGALESPRCYFWPLLICLHFRIRFQNVNSSEIFMTACVQFCNAIRWEMKRIWLGLRPCWYLLINTFSFPLRWNAIAYQTERGARAREGGMRKAKALLAFTFECIASHGHRSLAGAFLFSLVYSLECFIYLTVWFASVLGINAARFYLFISFFPAFAC